MRTSFGKTKIGKLPSVSERGATISSLTNPLTSESFDRREARKPPRRPSFPNRHNLELLRAPAFTRRPQREYLLPQPDAAHPPSNPSQHGPAVVLLFLCGGPLRDGDGLDLLHVLRHHVAPLRMYKV